MAKNTSYTSDVMNFIKDFLQNNSEVVQKQDDLRKTWWDIRPQNVDEARKLDIDNLSDDGYKYFSYKNKK
jgi:hypothetical protein